MRQLDTCDFCGTAADGVYEVVPAAIAGDPKRLALCADCRATLQSVVDPLLDAAGESTTTRSRDAGQQTVSATAADVPGESADETAAATASDDAAESVGTTDAADSHAGSNTSEGGTAVDDATTSGKADGDTAEAVPESAADAPRDEGVTIEQSEAAVEDEAAAESRDPRPDGYAKVVRLLQNRDGAMPREDLRALATNAYDLGSSEFEAAVQATIENGDVEETAEGLRTV